MVNWGKRGKRIKYQQETFFIMQVGKMLRHGLTLPLAIDYIARTQPELKQAARRLGHLLAAGQSLAAGMKRTGFSAPLCDQVAMAQANGQLSTFLIRLGQFQQGQHKRVQKLQRACLYPVFLLGFVGIILIVVRLVIHPQFAALGLSGETDYSRWLTTIFALVILSTAFIGWLFYRRWHAPMNGPRVQALMRWPVVGKIYRSHVYHTLLYDLSMLLGNGWTMKEIVTLQQSFGVGSLVAAMFHDMESQFAEGAGFDEIVTGLVYFPPEVSGLLAQGSGTEELAQELQVLADAYYETMLQQIDRLITRVQPICFLLVGLAVLCIYGELLMPIYGQMDIIQ